MRFLIAEDIKDVIDALILFFNKAFKDIIFDTAETVEDAMKMLRKTKKMKSTYDAIILDFKLPRAKGENPEVDESVCLEARKLFPKAIIAHITAYSDDHEIIKHNKTYHGPFDPIGFVVEKSMKEDTNYIDLLAENLFSSLIQKRLDTVFGQYSGTDTMKHEDGIADIHLNNQNGKPMNRFSQTHELSEIVFMINELWEYLNPKTRKRIERLFEVRTGGNKITIDII